MARTLSTPLTQSWQLGLRVAGAGLLVATGAIHLDLYLTGYRTIPAIGWLFLLQVIAAFGLAAAVLATGSRLAAAAGAGFALATLGGYLLSIWVGLFGFTEVRTTAGLVAGIIEVAAFAVLALMLLAPVTDRPASTSPLDRIVASVPAPRAVVAGVSVIALVLLGIAVATANGSTATVSSGGSLKTAEIGSVTVLTNAKGRTLYWFAPDTSTASKCYGSCATYWPPVKGPATAGAGVTGTLGTIKRADGSVQATYDGHPLYTYIGDSAPGQARGNNLNLNGGLWHEVTPSG
jgi:predicted lipoprotein with Yx(FWY)xxD motif